MLSQLPYCWWIIILLGIFAGIVSGLLGLGSGSVVVPVLVLLFAFDQKAAQGTALAVMVPMAMLGAFRYWRNPEIEVSGLVVVLIVVLVGFSVYNAEERVGVNILTTRYINVPLIVITFWAFIFGLVVSFLLFVTVYFRQVAEIRRQRRIADSLGSEISALRNRPIEESADDFLLSDKENNT